MPNAIAIVAHYDDAVLWVDGTIQRLREAGWHWTAVAMCIRERFKHAYFDEYSRDRGVVPIAVDFLDYQGGDAFCRNDEAQMSSRLADATSRMTFDLVFTHSLGGDGEYGWHANHVEVASVVASLVSDGRLGRGAGSLAHFCYHAAYGLGGLATVAKVEATHYLQLTYPELRRKCEWCDRVRPLDGSLECLAFPCPNPEAFDGNGLVLPAPFVSRR